jgi:hypothetical protein
MPSAAPKKIWFPAKRIGWGWGPPVCWQGWVVLLIYGTLLVAGGQVLSRKPHLVAWFYLYVLVICGMLTAVCWIKGEKPRWRWGEKDRSD